MSKKTKPDQRAVRDANAAKLRLQVGALCYRWTKKGELRILLITSRRTRRWIGPKGWPMRGKSHAEAAALEAQEEAGVEGKVAKKSIGFFNYKKNLGGHKSANCTVQVFPFEVTSMNKDFREKGQRKMRWLTPKKARKRADPQSFARLIKEFAQKAEASK